MRITVNNCAFNDSTAQRGGELVWLVLKEAETMPQWVVSEPPAATGNAKTWAETTRDSAAMDDIKLIIGQYMTPDSGVSAKDALSQIIRTIETKTGYRFITLADQKGGTP
jgi:hypothetical protein